MEIIKELLKCFHNSLVLFIGLQFFIRGEALADAYYEVFSEFLQPNGTDFRAMTRTFITWGPADEGLIWMEAKRILKKGIIVDLGDLVHPANLTLGEDSSSASVAVGPASMIARHLNLASSAHSSMPVLVSEPSTEGTAAPELSALGAEALIEEEPGTALEEHLTMDVPMNGD